MDRKCYTGEQILNALSEVGIGAGDISEVMSCLGRMPSAEPNLISRLSELRSQYNCFNENERDTYHTLSEAIEALNEQKTGKWIVDDEYIDCSYCRREKWSRAPYEQLVSGFRFCPNCGARMEANNE